MKAKKILSSDPILFFLLSFLVFTGLLMLFSASIVVSKEKTEGSTYYFFHQILYGLLPGIFLAFLTSKISLKFIKKITPFLYLISIILLSLVFVPKFSLSFGGARSWIHFGPIVFQPTEFAKLALILYLSLFFEKKIRERKIEKFSKGLLPFLLVLVPFSILLFFQPDMGSLGVLLLIGFLMYFSAGAPLSHTFFLVFLGIFLLIIGSFIFPHQAKRIFTFFHPQKDILGKSYQINQALIALGSGGIFGKGYGNSIQKYNYLPQPMGDTIFAIWGEEMGFLGSSFLILLFLLICWRGFIISKKANDRFSQLLGVGIVSWIGIQAFVHIMAVCGLIPFTGIPLPFVSYGGSALACILAGVGFLFNIARNSKI